MTLPLPGSECVLRVAANDSLNVLLVEGLRLSAWKVAQEEVDVTNLSHGSWRKLLSGAGVRSLQLRLSGLYLGSEGERRLRDLAFSGMAAAFELTLDQGINLHSDFIISELSFESKVNDEATYAATLSSAGAVTFR